MSMLHERGLYGEVVMEPTQAIVGPIQRLRNRALDLASRSKQLQDGTLRFSVRHVVGGHASQFDIFENAFVSGFAPFLDPFRSFDRKKSAKLMPVVL